MCSDVAAGLRHIHAHNVLHMDIKAENIYLHSSATFKIGDFGLAIVASNTSSRWQEGDGRYVAPELLSRASRPSAAADVYSLAASLLQCALGALPSSSAAPRLRCHSARFAGLCRSQPAALLEAWNTLSPGRAG